MQNLKFESMEVLSDGIKEKLQLSLRSTQVIREFLGELDARILTLDQISDAISASVQESDHTKVIFDILSQSGVDLKSQSAVKDFLSAVRQYLVNAPVLELELVFDPSATFVDKVFYWFKNNGFGLFFIRIKVVPDVCAGVRVIWGGKYYNLDMESVLEDYFLTNKDVIEGILQQKV